MKELLRQMLHIAPQRRPTAAQILRHPWLSRSRLLYNQPGMQHQAQQTGLMGLATTTTTSTMAGIVPASEYPPAENPEAIKGAVHATFRAIASPQAANLGPVGMSDLARRRKDKMNHS